MQEREEAMREAVKAYAEKFNIAKGIVTVVYCGGSQDFQIVDGCIPVVKADEYTANIDNDTPTLAHAEGSLSGTLEEADQEHVDIIENLRRQVDIWADQYYHANDMLAYPIPTRCDYYYIPIFNDPGPKHIKRTKGISTMKASCKGLCKVQGHPKPRIRRIRF